MPSTTGPKGAVKRRVQTGKLEKPTCEIPDPVQPGVIKQGHPGYFWLAYDWRNLVPACVFCNSGQGKNDRFDINKDYLILVKFDQAEIDAMLSVPKPRPSKKWPGYYYLSPESLDALEEPLLLNPLNPREERDPSKHIRFGVRGTVAAVDGSPLGRTSIEVFQLRAEELRTARQRAQETFRDKYYDAMRKFDPAKPEKSAANALLGKYKAGRFAFSAAALDYHKILQRAQAKL